MEVEKTEGQPMPQDQVKTEQTDQPQPKPNEEKPSGTTKYYREEFEKLRKQNETLAKQLEENKINQLKEKENWKELYQNEFQKREEAEIKAKSITETFVENLKMKEIEKIALSKGIRKEALADLELLDKSSVQVETTNSGRINFIGVEDFIEEQKLKRSYWFQDSRGPIINNAQPGAPVDRDLSASDILKLQRENPVKYREIMTKKLGK